MDKNWKDDQLGKVQAGNSIFHYIPQSIGNIVYCDTSEPREVPQTREQITHERMKVIPICVILIALLWCFLYHHYIWASIISTIIIIIAYILCNDKFGGTDYFVGDKGFAKVRFSDDRNKIVEENVVLYDNMEYLFTGEVIKEYNFSYQGTDYYFSVFNHEDDEHQFKKLFDTEGKFYDKKPKDPMNPEGAPQDYSFMKKVENQWSNFFINKHLLDDIITFGIIKDKSIYTDYIRISRDFFEIGNVKYTKENWKKYYISKGELVIEHENHSKKLFGLVEKGDISHIPLSDLGNRKAFLFLFEKFFKS